MQISLKRAEQQPKTTGTDNNSQVCCMHRDSLLLPLLLFFNDARFFFLRVVVSLLEGRRGQMSRGGHVNRVPFISGSEYPDELHLLLRNEVMIRRLKANVVKQLPPLRQASFVFLLLARRFVFLLLARRFVFHRSRY